MSLLPMTLVENIAKAIGFVAFLAAASGFLTALWPGTPLLFPFHAGVKFFMIGLDLVLFFGFLYAAAHAWPYRPDFNVSAAPARRKILTLQSAEYAKRWQSIIAKIVPEAPDSYRLAIIEADAFLDEVLKGIGLPGEHFADRLSRLDEDEVESVHRVWRAHRMRNDLVHTPGFVITPESAREALEDYESFLRELEVLT